MDSKVRTYVHDMTLKARKLLTTEVQELLEGVYGYRGGAFEPTNRLPGLLRNPEIVATRERLEGFLADEKRAGLRWEQALNKLIKEVAFTHLNRLIAFKMMESRKLIRGTVDKLHESNAFKFYLAAPAHADDFARYRAGDQPQNILGEGPRDVAYRHFLLWQTGQVAKEIRELFDPDNLASRLFPRPRALREAIQLVNASELRNAWLPESDETVGWVYQYFNEQEKAEVFERLYKQKRKIQAEDIPAATELFTPRWIVRFLVENTLGRLWLQMHPDSCLQASLAYLVPLAGECPRAPLRPVQDIALLDPACGTMHFGLVAFDLLVKMYEEELENAGRAGWPDRPSVGTPADIPAAIIEHNLYGSDIDLRAVQLSALTLYLKAKSLNPSAKISASNLVCADVLLLNSDRLDAFLHQSQFSRPIFERVIRAMWARLEDCSTAGTLVRVESEVSELVNRERQRFELEGRQTDFFGGSSANFEEEATNNDFWDVLEAQVMHALDEFTRHQAASGADESYFTGEATKGLRLLKVAIRRYDIVVTNPPYMSRRNMNDILARFLQSTYPRSKGDLYSAFIERCAEFLVPDGRLGMITQQSFMFISSYEGMRKRLLNSHALETMCHLGPRAFEEISGEKVNTTMFVIRSEEGITRAEDPVGTYFRLVKSPNAEAKRQEFEQALTRLQEPVEDRVVYRYCQRDFDAIPGSPWVYWITPGLRTLFATFPQLQEIAQPRVGLQTGDNFRFLRFWFEVSWDQIGFKYANGEEAAASGKRWFPYMKGGSFRRWYGNQEHVVNWAQNGKEIRNVGIESGRAASRPQNTEFYFRRGVTWTDITSGRFSARLSPGGFIFDVSGSSVFPVDISLVLAAMNSRLAQYVLKIINPTVHVQVGDLARLPVPTQSSKRLEELVEEAIDLARDDGDETSYEFVAPPSWRTGILDNGARTVRLDRIEQRVDEEVYRLYGISAADQIAIEEELAEPASTTEDPEASSTDSEPNDEPEDSPMSPKDVAFRWISYAVGIILDRFEPCLEGAVGHGRFSQAVAASLRSLAIKDGIATLDAGHPDDLPAKVEHALTLMLEETGATEVVQAALHDSASGDDQLRRFFERDFFRQHLHLYRKHPTYWLLQSSKRSYGLYVFHERITKDTLYVIQGNRYLGSKINRTRQRTEDLRRRIQSLQGVARRKSERELEETQAVLTELEEFGKALEAITAARNERSETVGWMPELDDGVLLNMAPLHSILPAWSIEPRKYWDRLASGDYDWSHTAMRYWPDRVKRKCQSDKSHAIAHSLLGTYGGDA